MPKNFKVVVSKLALPKIVIPQVATLADPKLAVRICLGGPISRTEVQRALEFAAHALKEQPAIATPFL